LPIVDLSDTTTNDSFVFVSNKAVLTLQNLQLNNLYGGEQSGAVYLSDGATVNILSVWFTNNSGHAVYADSTNGKSLTANIDQSYFISNGQASTYAGGAVRFMGVGLLNITNSIFQKNTALYGGAVSAYLSATVVMSSNTFQSNNALVSGGAISTMYSAQVLLSNCVFTSNSALSSSGAIDLWNNGTITASNCIFQQNQANGGSGVCSVTEGQLRLTDCVISDTTSGSSALVVTVNEDSRPKLRPKSTTAYKQDKSAGVVLERTSFSNNKATAAGGSDVFVDHGASFNVINSPSSLSINFAQSIDIAAQPYSP
jgi:hypothetical protein